MLPKNDDEEVDEEEECVKDQIVEHPTRDDWHEQRERGQPYEAVLHAHAHSTVVITVERRAARPAAGRRNTLWRAWK